MVTAVRLINVALNCHNKESVHGPWENVLNGEAPPELEESLAEPVPLTLGESAHVAANWSNT